MKFTPARLPGAWLIDLEPHSDERGFFARSWCTEAFAARELCPSLVQCGISFNRVSATLRGLHYQIAPHQEAKLVRCTRGEIFDVIVDLRPDSPCYRQWESFTLSDKNRRQLYIPVGIAHGFQTQTDNTEVFYQMSEFYHAESARGIHWQDPTVAITWPSPVSVISDGDRSLPVLEP